MPSSRFVFCRKSPHRALCTCSVVVKVTSWSARAMSSFSIQSREMTDQHVSHKKDYSWRNKQSSMKMPDGPGNSRPRRAAPGSGCILVPAQIRLLDCCSHMSFHLFLRSVAMVASCITFLWPAGSTMGHTAHPCTRFSDQNVRVTSRSMWEVTVLHQNM